MVKLKHLRHPFQTANAAKNLLGARVSMWRFANHGARRFKDDDRYDLHNVTEGFKSRIDDSSDDDALLERICTAYIGAVRQQSAPSAYQATEWWQQVRHRSLGPVIQALLTKDTNALRGMYRNFFRDPCSTGLLGAPYGMSKAYFGGNIKDLHRKFYLGHVLYRFDYWNAQTEGRFPLRHLAGPGIGNPFGVVINGTHINVGAEYAHYCAHRIESMLSPESGTVAEIGGGFGGMAYYLLRDRANVTYLDFDVPESIALTSYYLIKAFPRLKFLLYGEGKLTKRAITQADVVLLPVFDLENMPAESVDITFSSHSMSDISSGAMDEYLKHIDRMTKDCLFYIGKQQTSQSISSIFGQKKDSFELSDTRTSGWHSYKVSGAGVGGASGLAASTMLEQSYTRIAKPIR
ncbi:putative sugar O-methyltransferase [Tunturiibacter gelidiferens]|uniref:putative sugar O-methyltransferase n=1 Tax=Tunturiibacter gelidiferens TaxID=3069689 RepID=UPI003D9B292A